MDLSSYCSILLGWELKIDMKKLTTLQHSVIIGLLLSDGTLIKRNKGPKGGAYFSLTQTCNPENIYVEAHVELLHYVFKLFKDFTSFSEPRVSTINRNNKRYPYIYFNTVICQPFTELYHNWYIGNVKTVPYNIPQLIDPVALAFWAMGDGGKCRKGFHLNTVAFSTLEVELLIKVLKTNFDLNCSMHSRNRIYIPTKDIDKFKGLVSPYFCSKFNYKLA